MKMNETLSMQRKQILMFGCLMYYLEQEWKLEDVEHSVDERDEILLEDVQLNEKLELKCKEDTEHDDDYET